LRDGKFCFCFVYTEASAAATHHFYAALAPGKKNDVASATTLIQNKAFFSEKKNLANFRILISFGILRFK
jgi:hypothetical protein